MLMGGLLLAAIVALAVASYMEVRRTAIRTATDRVVSVTRQFREMFQQSGVQLRTLANVSARNPAFAEFARRPTADTRAAALAALAYRGPQAETVIGTQIRDSTGAVILSNIPAAFGLDTVVTRDVIPRSEPGDSAVLGQFRSLPNVKDTLAYPIGAPIPGADGLYLVRWRRLGVSRRNREQITQLIGSHASLVLGNTSAHGWTNLEGAVPSPGLAPTEPGTAVSYVRDPDRAEYLGAAEVVPGTPWTVVVDVPMSEIQIPVRAFMKRISIIAAIALLLGLVMAWIASRRITGPMNQLAERTTELDTALTQLRDAQDALVRRERLAMLGQLSSGVGHELRNPLGVMTNAVYYLKAVQPDAPANVHEYLDILQQQITLSEKIVGDLLDFARQKPPKRKPTPLLEATESQVAKLGRTDGVTVDIQVPEDMSPVLVDPIQLGQVILNLVTNAAQAMDGNGRVTVTATEDEETVSYEVTDTGPGVAPENLEKIFEPLFTTKARGIGLGLAVSRTLARANGGDLTVLRTSKQGTTFRLTLQKAEPQGVYA